MRFRKPAHLLGPIRRVRLSLALGLVVFGRVTAATAQMGPPMPAEKVVFVMGERIHYYEAGQGPDVILLHGLGGDGTNWAANLWPLSKRNHVIALDQIGFGHSDKPLIEYKIETFVEFLQGFLQSLGISKATLVGNSLGGWIAVDFAARHPGLVDKLVLVDAAGLHPQAGGAGPPADLNPSSVEGMRRLLQLIVYNKQVVTGELAERVFEGHMKSGDGYTIQRVLAGVLAGNQYEDEKLASVHTPTLIVWGRDDQLIPLSAGERFEKGIPGAKLVAIDQCGHVPQIEKPDEFNDAVQKFLAQP